MEAINLKINYTLKEFKQYSLRSEYIYSGTLLKFIPLYLIFSAMTLLSFFYYKNTNAGIFITFIMTAIPAFIAYKFNKSLEKEYSQYYKDGINFHFNETGIESSLFGEKLFVEYENISSYMEDQETFYIYLNSFICLFIPKKQMNSESIEMLSKNLMAE